MFKQLILLTIITLTLTLTASAAEDEVHGLYGDIYQGKVYSGMLDTEDPNRHLHYVFIPSQGNPVTDPVVLWMNGGPGCSSLLGLIQEHGPVIIPQYTKELKLNEYSWTKVANIIYLESPAGTGFSVNDNKEDNYFDDKKGAADNRKALFNFFERFPDFKKNDFYISGESYSGVYVPTLADLLSNDTNINLKGFIVGNGITDKDSDNAEAIIDFAYYHALYSKELRTEYEKHCPLTHQPMVSHECNEVRTKIRESLEGLNIYDIYRECPKAEESKYSPMLATLKQLSSLSYSALDYITKEFLTGKLGEEEPVNVLPADCLDDPYPTEFFNKPEIQELLHVRKGKWDLCNDHVHSIYKIGDSFSIYKDKLLTTKKLKIWFYTGDTDGYVPYNGSVNWITKLGLSIKSEYRKWVVDGQTAGFVQEYDGFTYLTIKAGAHMPAMWKRPEAFAMFSAYIKGQPLPDK
jgi:carboxypeptidase C (cathepsin A)